LRDNGLESEVPQPTSSFFLIELNHENEDCSIDSGFVFVRPGGLRLCPLECRSVPVAILQDNGSGTWQGKDLSVAITWSRKVGMFNLSGTVNFGDALSLGYTVLYGFQLSAVFLDANSGSLSTTGVANNRGATSVPFLSLHS